MNKLNKILATLSAIVMLSVTAANSVEFSVGLSANSMGAYANVEEKLKDSGRISNEEAVLATAFGSGFVEVGSDEMMGLALGISYAPEVAELNRETRAIQASTVGDTGNQILDGKIVDLVSVYLSLPVGEGAFVKAGYIQATLNTGESLATGSKYPNIDLEGMMLAGGYQADLGSSGLFWRAEGQYQMWDDIAASGSEAGGTSGSVNKITAELGAVQGALSIGMKF
ncbi:hypothetical protein OA508_01980 [Candidatus Pelagibacter sp.]|nr:hypothetical protein [Candidatus Pelagibacter sp.]